MVDAALVRVTTQCPPVQEFIKASRLERSSAAKEHPALHAEPLIRRQIVLNFLQAIGSGHAVVLGLYLAKFGAMGEWDCFATMIAIDIDKFGNARGNEGILY